MLNPRLPDVIRFAVISASTLGVLGLLFFLFVWHAQPHAAVATTSPVLTNPSPVIPNHSADSLGPSSGPWMISYDATGRIVSKFTADDLMPQKTGSYKVKNPIALFYLDKGQIMRVTGDRGEVNCDSTPPNASKGMMATPTATPRNGLLHRVHIELYPSASSTVPIQWMDADNIHFDNDHLRMWTEAFTDEQGNQVKSDQVPVTIRGDQYEFDGKGMFLVWNGVSRRLERLEIMHGHRLEIKDLSKLSLPGMSAPEPAKPSVTVQIAPVPDQLASTDRSSVTLAMATPQAAPATTQPPTPYRAVFKDQVVIDDAGRTMATADVMTVDFLQGAASSQSAASPQAATPPTPPASAPTVASNPPPSPLGNTAATPASDKPAANQPATKPTNGPVTIFWTGPLVVTPLHGEPMMPLATGQSVVKLTGVPVKLTPEGSHTEAAAATYRSPDGAAILESSPAVPHIHLTQVKGLELVTERIDYDPATTYAIVTGPSALRVPVGTRPMDVTWSKIGKLQIARSPGQPNGVKHVDLTDDVHVSHPQFTLDSRQLLLDLDLIPKPRGTATEADEQLKLLTAIDNVKVRLIDPAKTGKTAGVGTTGGTGIDTDKLVIHTVRGTDNSTFPREVEAFGHVHAFDPDQSILSDVLDAWLLSKPKPGNTHTDNDAHTAKASTNPAHEDVASAVELDSLHARSNVHAKLKSGATADTDDLRISGPVDNRLVLLTDPAGSTLTNGKTSKLQSKSVIRITPDQGGLGVEGPGEMSTVRVSSTTQPVAAIAPQPTVVTWMDSMQLQSKKDIADFYGHVTVINHDADGSSDTITGDQCHLDLVDSPKNKEAKPPQPGADPTASAMGGKDLKKLTLTGNVIGYTELPGPNGKPLRRGKLFGNQLIYTTADGIALIPGPGSMVVENHKPDDAKAASPPGEKRTDEKKTGNNRGAMAVQWKKQLTYNQTTQIITIDGDTVAGFEQESNDKKPKKPQDPMQLYSQKLVITLSRGESIDGDAEDANIARNGKMQLTRMEAFTQVRFIAPTVNLTCGSVEYDPLNSLLTARGTPHEPGETWNATQTVTGSFKKLEYDTIKEEVLRVEGAQVQTRH